MNSDNDNQDHSNKIGEELRRALNDEVPAAAPGYWDEIDARLESVASDRSTSPDISVVRQANPDTAASDSRLMDMDTTNSTQNPPTSNPFRPLLLVAAAAAIVIAGVFGVSQLRDTTSTLDVTDTPGLGETADDTTSENTAAPVVDPDIAPPSTVPILIPAEFDVLSPVESVQPFEFEMVGPDLAGTLCESGLEARHPRLLPVPSEQASAFSGGETLGPRGTVDYTRFVFETQEEAAAVMDMWGEGRCEATFNTVDGVPTDDGTILIADQPVTIALPANFDAAAIQLKAAGDIPVGILVVGAGAEIVLAVTVDPPNPADIPEILEAAASAYN